MDEDVKYRFDSIESKIDKLVELNERQTEKLHDHDIQLTEYNKQLEIHIEATNLLKEDLKAHKKDSADKHDELYKDLQPILDSKKGIQVLKKWLVGLGTLAGAVYAIARVMGWM